MRARLFIAAFACAATFAISQAVTPAAPAVPPPLSSIPMTLGSWRGAPAPELSADVAQILAADQYVHRYYTSGTSTIEMDVAYYTRPRVGANMHSPLNCLPGNGWEIVRVGETTLDVGASSWPLRELTVQRGTAKYALTYWFQTRDRIVSDELSSRLYLLSDALQRRPVDSSLVRLIAPAEVSEQDPQLLRTFATLFIPELTSRLD